MTASVCLQFKPYRDSMLMIYCFRPATNLAFTPFIFLPLSLTSVSTGWQKCCAAHNICSYALNPAKLNPSSRNTGTSHAWFQPLYHVCSSQREEAVTVKGVFLLSVNIFLISCFIQILFYCLLQVWKPVFPQAGCSSCLHYKWSTQFWFVVIPIPHSQPPTPITVFWTFPIYYSFP